MLGSLVPAAEPSAAVPDEVPVGELPIPPTPPMPPTGCEPLPMGTTGPAALPSAEDAGAICAERLPPPRMATAMSGEPGSDRTAAPAVLTNARALPARTSEKGAPSVLAVGRGVVSTPTTSGAEEEEEEGETAEVPGVMGSMACLT